MMVACSIGCLFLQVVRSDCSTLAHCDAVRGEASNPIIQRRPAAVATRDPRSLKERPRGERPSTNR